MLGVTVTVAPTFDPLEIADAKDHMRITDADDDPYIESVIDAVVDKVQEELSIFLAAQTITYTLDAFAGPRRDALSDFWYSDHPLGFDRQSPNVLLPFAPVNTISSIQYVDTAGTTQALSSANYQLAAVTAPARIRPINAWPVTKPDYLEAVTITLTVGYASAAAMPARLVHGLKLAVAHMYEHREPFAAFGLQDVPGLGSLLEDFRVRHNG